MTMIVNSASKRHLVDHYHIYCTAGDRVIINQEGKGGTIRSDRTKRTATLKPGLSAAIGRPVDRPDRRRLDSMHIIIIVLQRYIGINVCVITSSSWARGRALSTHCLLLYRLSLFRSVLIFRIYVLVGMPVLSRTVDRVNK